MEQHRFRADTAKPGGGGGTSRILPLEALRGMAALLVILHHYLMAFFQDYMALHPRHDITGLILKSCFNGSGAVMIFFVLSGYVLARKGQRPDALTQLPDMMLRRWPRLMPLVAFSVVTAWLAYRAGWIYAVQAARLSGSEWFAAIGACGSTLPCPPSVSALLRQALFSVFLRGECPLNGSLWTMAFEFYGSFMVLAAAFFLRPRLRILAAAGCLLAVSLAIAAPYPYILYLPFFLGYAAAFLRVHERHLTPVQALILLLPGLAGYAYFNDNNARDLLFLGGLITLSMKNAQLLVESFGAFALVCVFSADNMISRRFHGAISYWLGQFSFSAYVMHFTLLMSLSSYAYFRLGGGNAGAAAALILLFLSLIPVAWALSRIDTAWLQCLGKFHVFRRFRRNEERVTQ